MALVREQFYDIQTKTQHADLRVKGCHKVVFVISKQFVGGGYVARRPNYTSPQPNHGAAKMSATIDGSPMSLAFKSSKQLLPY